jgi:integrase
VTHLRQIMLEELERRNYAPGTITSYIRTVEHFARHFHRAPDQLGPEHIRQYQAAMFREWKLSQNTVSQRLGALRFFYTQVLKQTWSTAETPYPKKVLHLPQVLSREEVAHLIDAAQTPAPDQSRTCRTLGALHAQAIWRHPRIPPVDMSVFEDLCAHRILRQSTFSAALVGKLKFRLQKSDPLLRFATPKSAKAL